MHPRDCTLKSMLFSCRVNGWLLTAGSEIGTKSCLEFHYFIWIFLLGTDQLEASIDKIQKSAVKTIGYLAINRKRSYKKLV